MFSFDNVPNRFWRAVECRTEEKQKKISILRHCKLGWFDVVGFFFVVFWNYPQHLGRCAISIFDLSESNADRFGVALRDRLALIVAIFVECKPVLIKRCVCLCVCVCVRLVFFSSYLYISRVEMQRWLLFFFPSVSMVMTVSCLCVCVCVCSHATNAFRPFNEKIAFLISFNNRLCLFFCDFVVVVVDFFCSPCAFDLVLYYSVVVVVE